MYFFDNSQFQLEKSIYLKKHIGQNSCVMKYNNISYTFKIITALLVLSLHFRANCHTVCESITVLHRTAETKLPESTSTDINTPRCWSERLKIDVCKFIIYLLSSEITMKVST